jgi:hypothetical protein
MWNIKINRSNEGDEDDDEKDSDKKKIMRIPMLMIMRAVNDSYD